MSTTELSLTCGLLTHVRECSRTHAIIPKPRTRRQLDTVFVVCVTVRLAKSPIGKSKTNTKNLFLRANAFLQTTCTQTDETSLPSVHTYSPSLLISFSPSQTLPFPRNFANTYACSYTLLILTRSPPLA